MSSKCLHTWTHSLDWTGLSLPTLPYCLAMKCYWMQKPDSRSSSQFTLICTKLLEKLGLSIYYQFLRLNICLNEHFGIKHKWLNNCTLSKKIWSAKIMVGLLTGNSWYSELSTNPWWLSIPSLPFPMTPPSPPPHTHTFHFFLFCCIQTLLFICLQMLTVVVFTLFSCRMMFIMLWPYIALPFNKNLLLETKWC